MVFCLFCYLGMVVPLCSAPPPLTFFRSSSSSSTVFSFEPVKSRSAGLRLCDFALGIEGLSAERPPQMVQNLRVSKRTLGNS